MKISRLPFTEVGQLVLKCVLEQLEADTHHIAQPVVAQNERLQPPAKEVSRHKAVHFVLNNNKPAVS